MSKKEKQVTEAPVAEETAQQNVDQSGTFSVDDVEKDLKESGLLKPSIRQKIQMLKFLGGTIFQANKDMLPKVATAKSLEAALGLIRGSLLAMLPEDKGITKFAHSKTGTILIDTVVCQLLVVFSQLMIMGGHARFQILSDEATRLNQGRIFDAVRVFEVLLSKLPFIGEFMDMPDISGLGAVPNMGVGDLGEGK